MRPSRALPILLILAVGLTLWWVIVERPRMMEVLYPGRLFGHLVREDIERIEIEKPEQTIILARAPGGGWRLEGPIEYPAATGPMDTMVGALVFLEAKQFLEGPIEGAFPETGPRLIVRFAAQGEVSTIEIGNRHLAEALHYYRVGPRLFLADESLKLYADRTVADWREKAVCPISPQHAGRLEVEGGGRRLVVERTKRGGWFLREPIKARADAGSIEAIIDGVNSLAAAEFLRDDGKAPLAGFGLESPRYRVKVRSIAGDAEVEVLVGDRVGAGEPAQIYVKRADRLQVFRCEDTATAGLERGPADLRDRRVLPFADHGWVRQISVRGQGQDFSLTRPARDTDWMLLDRSGGGEPRKIASPQERGDVLLDEIGNLKIGAFRPGEAIGAEQFRIALVIDGAADPQVLVFGRGNAEGVYLCRRSGVEGEEDVPIEVSTSLPGRIGTQGSLLYEDLKRAEIEPERLLGFEIITVRGVWDIARLNEWCLAETPDRTVPLDQGIVGEAAEVIRKPTAMFFEPNPGPLADLGLERSRATLRVRMPKGIGELPYRELIIGRRLDPKEPVSYAMLDSDPVVFMMDPTPLIKLAEHLAAVAGR